MTVADTLDVRGLGCPMPVIRTKKAMDALESGAVLEVLATDRGSLRDIPAWARAAGHELLSASEDDGLIRFHIRKR